MLSRPPIRIARKSLSEAEHWRETHLLAHLKRHLSHLRPGGGSVRTAVGSLPDEVLLVLDATAGQNALLQAESFDKYAKLTGIALTKLDGTAKGGIIFAISKKLNLPIRFVGVGEGIDDLKAFDSKLFISALFTD